MSHVRPAGARLCLPKFAIIFLVVCAMIAPTVRASVVAIPENGGAVFRKDGSKNTPASGIGRLGAQSSSFPAIQGRRAVVYVFQLPAPPLGESPLIVDASFQFTVVMDEPDGAYNIDLGARPIRPLNVLQPADGLAPAALIQDNILVQPHPDSGVQTITTSPAGNAALASFLNEQYAGGLGIGQFLPLRLAPDVDPLPNEDTGFDVAFGNSPTNIPVLSITFAVPEPGIPCAAISLTFLQTRRGRRPPR